MNPTNYSSALQERSSFVGKGQERILFLHTTKEVKKVQLD